MLKGKPSEKHTFAFVTRSLIFRKHVGKIGCCGLRECKKKDEHIYARVASNSQKLLMPNKNIMYLSANHFPMKLSP